MSPRIAPRRARALALFALLACTTAFRGCPSKQTPDAWQPAPTPKPVCLIVESKDGQVRESCPR